MVTDLTSIHPLANVRHPASDFVALHEARVALVEALERLEQLRLRIKLEQVLAHHREKHGEVDAAVLGCVGLVGSRTVIK
jgi:hypothetical protein